AEARQHPAPEFGMLAIGNRRAVTAVRRPHFAATLRVRCPQSNINYAGVGLCPRFIFNENRLHLAKIKCGVDVVAFDVMFNPSKLFSKRLTVLVVLLDGAHSFNSTSYYD